MSSATYPTTVFVLGTERNIGKTVTSIGIISTLLSTEHGYAIDDIGYIKPVGQQTVKVTGHAGARLDLDKDAVLLTALLGVQCTDLESLSPVVWRGGTTAALIDQAAAGDAAQPREQMLERIRAAYRHVAQGRRVVIAEGTGQPGVGSVSGISNADVINALRGMGVPVFVVLVARGGIGSTIDEIFPYIMTLDHVGCRLDGLIINGVTPAKMDKVRHYLQSYYARVFPQLYGHYLTVQGAPPILGFVPTIDDLRLPSMRLVFETLSESADAQPQVVAPESMDSAVDLIRDLKVISLDFGYESFLKPGDAVVVGVNANSTIRGILRLHRQLEARHGAGLAGLLLSCSAAGGLAAQTRSRIQSTGLPTLMLNDDSATIVQRIEAMTVKIQPYDTAKRDLIAAAYGEHVALWPELRDAPRVPGVAGCGSGDSAQPLTTTGAHTEFTMTGRQSEMVERQIHGRGIRDAEVLAALARVPREAFVPDEYQDEAFTDGPLPIGYGQTISQPYIVAAMTELLRLTHASRVLEIGTGSGYQAAILAELTAEVYSIETIPELCKQARQRLARLGYHNVQVRCGDGYGGWPEHAPYDAIIVTAAPDHIPQPLVAQLADGGRMVIPVGPPGGYQVLWLLERAGDEVRQSEVMGVAFVPLTRRGESGGVEQA